MYSLSDDDTASAADSDVVDLRLAESYAPILICIFKCCAVILVHLISPLQPVKAHVISATLLILDRVSRWNIERIIDTNAITWGCLCCFILSTVDVQGLNANVNSSNDDPYFKSVFFSLSWTLFASLHLLQGGFSMRKGFTANGWGKMSFQAGLRLPNTPLPKNEIVACVVTGLMVIMVCDPLIKAHLHSQVVVVAARTFMYIVLSSLWSYSVVVLNSKKKVSGSFVAQSTSILTATRFMCVFYVPMKVAIVWSTLSSFWMLWVGMRHRRVIMSDVVVEEVGSKKWKEEFDRLESKAVSESKIASESKAAIESKTTHNNEVEVLIERNKVVEEDEEMIAKRFRDALMKSKERL
jgi:hypothetical protein